MLYVEYTCKSGQVISGELDSSKFTMDQIKEYAKSRFEFSLSVVDHDPIIDVKVYKIIELF